MIRYLFGAAAALCLFAAVEPAPIRPGDIWNDDRGRHIQAHGGGIIRSSGTWYWFGEDRGRGLDPTRRYVSCYSSTDRVHWTFRNQVIKLADPGRFRREMGAGAA